MGRGFPQVHSYQRSHFTPIAHSWPEKRFPTPPWEGSPHGLSLSVHRNRSLRCCRHLRFMRCFVCRHWPLEGQRNHQGTNQQSETANEKRAMNRVHEGLGNRLVVGDRSNGKVCRERSVASVCAGSRDPLRNGGTQRTRNTSPGELRDQVPGKELDHECPKHSYS